MTVQTTTGTKFSIGTTVAATTLTAFKGDTYTSVGEIESFGAFGDESELVRFTSLSDSRVRKVAGPSDAGDIEMVVGYDPSDAGQTALIAAFDANAGLPFNFKVELNNALTTGTGPHHGTNFYFKGVVISKRIEPGAAKDVVKLNVKVAITSGITQDAAA